MEYDFLDEIASDTLDTEADFWNEIQRGMDESQIQIDESEIRDSESDRESERDCRNARWTF